MNEEKISFKGTEIAVLLSALRRTSLEISRETGMPPERRFTKENELIAFNTFQELKKALNKETMTVMDYDLILGTLQKKLLIDCLNSIQRGLNDLENKISAMDKLMGIAVDIEETVEVI